MLLIYMALIKQAINEFDLKSMVKNPAIVLITKRGGGKTWLCRELIGNFGDIPVGIVISYSERTDRFYKDFFPDTFIFHENCPNIFARVLIRQRRIMKKAALAKARGKHIDTRILLLMDDCLSDSKVWGNDKALKEILYNGRHYDITYILTMQAPLAIGPDLRDNFDYVFLLYTDAQTQYKKLYEHYAGMFPSLSTFKDYFTQLTNDYGVMVIKRRNVTSRELSDKVFHFKASDRTPKLFGCKQFTTYHKKNYNEHWSDKVLDEEFNFSAVTQRKNAIKVQVVGLDGKLKID